MAYKSVKGTKDLLPTDTFQWRYVESVIQRVMDAYHYGEIRTPVFEETSVFSRGIGEETDIVGKEMYTFTDKGGTSLTLRPELTAPVIRSYIQHSLGEQSSLTKVFYIGPMFRQERPQAGRYRQFHQFGFECIGLPAPECDVEIIAMAAEIYRRLGVPYTLKLNSVGDPDCRPRYREELQKYLRGVYDELSPESQRRTETNPMRVLDSKNARDRELTENAPVILDYLTDDSRKHFDRVRSLLEGLSIPYQIDTRLVRGLDYYTRTAFEFVSSDLGSQDALGGGGRYDGLVDQLGGKSTPAVGFAAGIERLLMVLEKQNFTWPENLLDCYLVGLDDDSRTLLLHLAAEMRSRDLKVDLDFGGRSMKAQMREANKMHARFVVIVGEAERHAGAAVLKRMADGQQAEVPFDELTQHLLSADNAS